MSYLELKNLVKYHSRLYYDLSKPEISDSDFDKLYDQLVALEKAQGWGDYDSPTKHIGGFTGKIKHKTKLYSLKKVYDESEVDPSFDVITPKIDGANLTLIYENHKLIKALTRGNGEFGEDITYLIDGITNIPKKIISFKDIEVNGECVTDNEVENFRNYVSGALGLNEVLEFKTRNIKFIAHDVFGVNLDYTARLSIIKQNGFTTVLDTDICSKYPQDGVVYRLNSLEKSKDLGYTAKYPRFAVALKSRGELVAETVLHEVQWVVGRTGTINPIGIIKPVILDGATISRVTLHNIGIIEANRLGLGDTILIERAGGVIPKFIRVTQKSQHNLLITQKSAEQALGMSVKRIGPKLYCSDNSQISTTKLVEHFIKTLRIKGLGPASVSKLNINHPAELFEIRDFSILGANGEKIKEELERAKTKPYEVVLAALGIPKVGEATAVEITNHINKFSEMREIEFMQIPGIGPKTIQSILAWLDINEEWVKTLPLKLFKDKSIEAVNDTDVLNKKVCITGKLDMPRSELADILINLGYIVKNSVTKDCYALIFDGSIDSNKIEKANQYNVKIINYFEKKLDILKGNF